MPADLILVNLTALPPAPTSAAPELIAIRGRRIVYAGGARALSDLTGPDTRVLDCGAGLVVPGFNDAHCHPIAHAATLRHVDCSSGRVRDIPAIQAALRARAVETGAGQWVRAAGCDPAALAERRLPTRRELDAAVPNRPVVLVEQAGQSCVLNSMAVALSGLDDVAGIAGMVAGTDPRVAGAIPSLPAAEIEAGLRQVSRLYLENGITSIQDTSWSNGYRHWQAMRHFKAEGLLVPRMTMLVGIDGLEEFKRLGLRTGHGDDHLRLGAMKIALDESTAAMLPSQDDITAAALLAHGGGFQLSFHAPDPTLLSRALHAIAAVRTLSPRPVRPPRLEHCPLCPPSLLSEIAGSGAIPVLQPNLLFAAGPSYLERMSGESLPWVFPIRSFLATGIPVAFGSDSPLTSCNPLSAIATAVSRVVAGGSRLGPDEAITLAEALHCYCATGARCSGEETVKGRIAVGMLADLAVLDRNPRTSSLATLAETRVVITVLDGKIVWEG